MQATKLFIFRECNPPEELPLSGFGNNVAVSNPNDMSTSVVLSGFDEALGVLKQKLFDYCLNEKNTRRYHVAMAGTTFRYHAADAFNPTKAELEEFINSEAKFFNDAAPIRIKLFPGRSEAEDDALTLIIEAKNADDEEVLEAKQCEEIFRSIQKESEL